MKVRILFLGFVIVVVFLLGMLYADSPNKKLFTYKQEFDHSVEVSQAQPVQSEQLEIATVTVKEENYPIERLASRLEKITSSFFNMIISFLYEISRLFF